MTAAAVSKFSALGPVDHTSVPEPTEKESSAPWIIRKLVGVGISTECSRC